MRFFYDPLFGLTRERRMLRDNEQGATEQDRKKMENLHMAEFREKSKYVYDKVQDRVNEYRNEVGTLRNQLRGVQETGLWKSKQDKSLQKAEKETGRIQTEVGKTYKTYSDDVLKEMSKGNKDIARMAQLQERLFYRVDTLEHFYTYIENEISQVEQSLIAKNVDVQPTLQQRMQQRRLKTFEDQRKASRPEDQLRTIELDWYSRPFDKMEQRAYHLLRLPSSASVSFQATMNGMNMPQLGREYDVINLSGGAKYIKFTSEFMKALPDNMDPQPFVMKITVKDPDGGPDKTYDAIPHKTKDGLNNLTFSFTQEKKRPTLEARKEPRKKEESKEPPKEEKKESSKTEEQKPKDEPIQRLRQSEKQPEPPNLKDGPEFMSLDAIRTYMEQTYIPSLNESVGSSTDPSKMMQKTGFENRGDGRFVYTENDREVSIVFRDGRFELKSVNYTQEYLTGRFVDEMQRSFDRMEKTGVNATTAENMRRTVQAILKDVPGNLSPIFLSAGCISSEINGVTRIERKLKNGQIFVIEVKNGAITQCGVGEPQIEKKANPARFEAQKMLEALLKGTESIDGPTLFKALADLVKENPTASLLEYVLKRLGFAVQVAGELVSGVLAIGANKLTLSAQEGTLLNATIEVPDTTNQQGPYTAAIVPLAALTGLPIAKIAFDKVKNLAGVRQRTVTNNAPSGVSMPEHLVFGENLRPYLKPGVDPNDVAYIIDEYLEMDYDTFLEPSERKAALAKLKEEIKARMTHPEQFEEVVTYYQKYDNRLPAEPAADAPPIKDAPRESGKKTTVDGDKKTVLEKKPAEKAPLLSDKWAKMEGKIKAQLRNPSDPKALEEVKGLLNRLSIRIDPRKLPPDWQVLRDKDLNRLKELLKDGASADELLAEYAQSFRVKNASPKPQVKETAKAVPKAPKVYPPMGEDVAARIRSTGNPYKILGLDPENLPRVEQIGKMQNKLLVGLVKDPKDLAKLNKLISDLYLIEVANNKDITKLISDPEWKALKKQIKELLRNPVDIDVAEKLVKARHMVVNRNPSVRYDFDEDTVRVAPDKDVAKYKEEMKKSPPKTTKEQPKGEATKSTEAPKEAVKAPPVDTDAARIRGSKNPYEILGLDPKALPSEKEIQVIQNKLLAKVLKDPKDLSGAKKLIAELYQIEVDAGKDVAKLRQNARWKELKQQIKLLLKDAKDIDIAEKIVKARHMVINKNPSLFLEYVDVDKLLASPPKEAPKAKPAQTEGKTIKQPEAKEAAKAKDAKRTAETGKEAAKLAKAEAMKKFLELTKDLPQEKFLAALTEHGASLGLDAKAIAGFQKSAKSGTALYEASKLGDAAGLERLLKAGQGASKMRIALNTLGVGLDVFALAMTYNDWQANGGRIEAAEATGNKALASLYKDAYVMYGVEGATTLVCGTVALVSSTAGLCLLPVTMVVMGAGHVYREVEGMRENMLKTYKDYLGLPPAEMLHRMHELLNTYSYTGKAFVWMGKGATWEDAKQTEFSHAANALTQLTRSYLMKTAEVSPSPDEKPEDYQKRFELFIRDAMDYLGRQTGSRYTQASSWELPALFRRAMAHAQLCATSRELSSAGMSHEIKWKGDDGKEYTFDLSKYHEAPPDGLDREGVRKWREEKEKVMRAYMGERDAEKFDSVKNVVGLMNEKNKGAEKDPGMARQKFMQQMLLQDITHDLHKFDQVLQFSDFNGLDIPLISEGDTNARTLVRYATFLILRKELCTQATALLEKPNMEKKDYDQAVQNLRNLLNPSERGALVRQQFAENKKLNETNDFSRAKAFANRLLQPEYILQNLALPSTNITLTGSKEKPADVHLVFESHDRTIITGPDGVAHLKGMKDYSLVPIKNGMVYSNEGVRAGSDDFQFHGEGYFAVWKPENSPLYGNAFTTPDLVIRIVKPETAAERGKTIDNPLEINHRNPPRSLTRPYGSPLYLRMPGSDYQWGRFGPNGQVEEVLTTNQTVQHRGELSINAPGEYGFWPKGHPEQHFQIHIN